MPETTRRQFLGGPLAAAALASVAPAAALAHPGDSAEAPLSEQFFDAVIGGDTEALERLLARDPSLLGARDAEGCSAFARALLHRHSEIAALLRDRGYTPDLHEAALALDWDLFESMAESSPHELDLDHPVGGSAMLAAARGGAGNDIWRVYQFGADPNVQPRGAKGPSALRAALDFPDRETAELTAATLLANGADPNLGSDDGITALHAAVRHDSADLVEMLLRKGATVGARDPEGRSALELAESLRHLEAAAVLRRAADLPRDHSTSRSAYDLEGRPYVAPDLSVYSVLTIERLVGASHGAFDRVRAVVEAHPELAKAQASTTEFAVEACGHTGRRPIVDYLLEHGAPYSLPTAVMRGDRATAERLLDEDPKRIHERGPHDFALLWYTAIGGELLELAELLLARGARIEQQHYLGTTTLHWAALSGQLDLAAFLIEHGADVNRVGRKFGGVRATPLAIAQRAGRSKVIELLRSHGARG